MAVYRPKYRDPKTGAYVPSHVWWFDFVYQGKRCRGSTGQTLKTLAVEFEKNERRRIEQAYAGKPIEDRAQRIRTVAEALKEYETAYRVNHRRKSAELVSGCSKHLLSAFGDDLKPSLSPTRIIGYMEQRQAEGASGRTINMEIGVLARAIGWPNEEYTWKILWPKVKKLDENHDVGRALEPEEEKRILDAALENRSKLIYPFLMVLAWTGMRSDEARTLRWKQVDFEGGLVCVGKSKTEAGIGRIIPMSGALKIALERHAAFCARKLGPLQPEWYVFPRSNRIKPLDATEPATSLKTAWETIREKAGVECRLHDFRHSFCTKLGEKGVPESTMLDMMGHVSPGMLRRYSHIRAKARREAIDAIEGKPSSFVVPQESPKADSGEVVPKGKNAVTPFVS